MNVAVSRVVSPVPDGVPVINKGGLAEDWLIWSIVSLLVLYIVSARRLYIVSARKTEGEQEQALDPAASA